jgi:PAS domain S-box-containing protein
MVFQDGERWLEVSVDPIYDSEGNIKGAVHVVSDITASKQAEIELKNQFNTYYTLLQNLDGMVYNCENEKKWTMNFVSEGCFSLTGYKPEDLIQNKKIAFRDVILPEYRDIIWDEWQDKLKRQETVEMTYQIKTASEKIKWVWERGQGVFDEKGKLLHLEGYITDITERKSAMEEIEKLAKFPAQNPNPVLRVKQQGTVLYNNEAGAQLLNEWQFKNGKIHQEECLNIIRNTAEYGETKTVDIQIIDKTFSLVFSPIKATDFINIYGMDISEKKKAEMEIYKVKSLLEQTGKIAKIGGWEYDVLTLEGTWTAETARIHDLDPNKSTNVELGMSFYTPESKKKIEQATSEAIKSGTSYDLELELISAKGKHKWVRSIGMATKEKGKIIKMSGTFQDITVHKKADDELRKLSTAVKQSPSIIIITDVKGNQEYVNPKFSEITGYSFAEILNKNPRILKSGKHTGEFYKKLWKTISSGKEWRGEFLNKKKNGELFWEAASISPIHNKQGKIINYIKVAEDITERKINENKIKKSEKKYRDIFENIQDIYYETDFEGKITEMSPSIYQFSKGQYSRDELIGKQMSSFYYDTIEKDQVLHNLMKHKRLVDYEVTLQNKDGSLIQCSFSSIVQSDSAGNPQKIIGSMRDITERKIAEDQIARDLEEKNTLLKELYHRTKNNMQVISSMLKMQAQHSDNEFIHESFKEIIHKIQAMSLVHQKLYQAEDLSRINLKEYIGDILKLLMISYNIRSELFSFKLDLKNVFVTIDSATPLGLVLNELISNVFKHSFPDNRKGKLNIDMGQEENGDIKIQLTDNGVGLPSGFNPEKTKSMGLQTAYSLVNYQLDGSLNYKVKNGLSWFIKFNDAKNKLRV